MIPPTVLERVDAGFDWLDENLPDWREIVNPAQLDMTWEESCILGQYHFHKYGETSFDRIAHAHFGGDIDRLVELGFLAIDFNYTELNEAWQQKFAERGMLDHDKEAES